MRRPFAGALAPASRALTRRLTSRAPPLPEPVCRDAGMQMTMIFSPCLRMQELNQIAYEKAHALTAAPVQKAMA